MVREYSQSFNINLAAYFMEESESSYSKALEIDSSDSNWTDKIKIKTISLIDIYCEWLIEIGLNEDKVVTLLLKLKEKSIDLAKCQILYQLATLYYKSSITSLESNLNKSFRCINECNYYYEECLKLHNQYMHLFYFDFDLEEFNSDKIIQVSLSIFKEKKVYIT